MQNEHSRPTLDRRDFLRLLAAAGITAAGGYALSEYTPWLDYDQQARQIRRPIEKDLSGPASMRALARFATLAANGHNTQPWMFSIREHTVEIHPDPGRGLPVVDPHQRELWISLGCALENLLVAARACGFAPEVVYPETADFIQVRLTADTPQQSDLFTAILLRQNTRSEYDGQSIPSHDLDQLLALPPEPGVGLRFVTHPTDLATVGEYVNQATVIQYADPAFLDELIRWLRFNKKEALAALDGLFARCSGSPETPRWLGRLFVDGMKAQQQSDADVKKLRSSAAAVIIASETEEKAAWVRTGQVYERLALKMTSLNIKSAFLNQPIEVANVRPQFQSAIGLGSARPQLLVRMGYAESMPHSLRRPMEQTLMNG